MVVVVQAVFHPTDGGDGEDLTKVAQLVAEIPSSATVVIGAVIRVGINLQIKGKTHNHHLEAIL